MTKAGEVSETARWTIYGERVVDDSQRGRLSIAEVELSDGVTFEQYVLRLRKGAIVAVVNEGKVLMMWRHRFVIDQWVWELPGGYVDETEDPAITAAREVEEETGWRPLNVERVRRLPRMRWQGFRRTCGTILGGRRGCGWWGRTPGRSWSSRTGRWSCWRRSWRTWRRGTGCRSCLSTPN
jgi:8-oxo-dGTP pyrophosphatase MutT (NUDIX family)